MTVIGFVALFYIILFPSLFSCGSNRLPGLSGTCVQDSGLVFTRQGYETEEDTVAVCPPIDPIISCSDSEHVLECEPSFYQT